MFTRSRVAKVDAALIQAVVDGSAESLSDKLSDVYEFIRLGVVAATDPVESREKLQSRYG